MGTPETIKIDAVEYVRKDSVSKQAEQTNGMTYCVIRTYSAGVHVGYVKKHEGQEVTLINSRRLWRWSGAASLSQVATEGCESEKFAVVLPEIILTDAIEIIPCSQKAKEVLGEIPEWKC
jgi:hypothetical protein